MFVPQVRGVCSSTVSKHASLQGNADHLRSVLVPFAHPQYYTFVNKDPAKLHCFYTKKSTLIHGVEGEDCTPCYGQQVSSVSRTTQARVEPHPNPARPCCPL